MRWWNREHHAADTNTAFDTLFFNMRNEYVLGAHLEANKIQRLTGTNVSTHHITQMAREIVAVQNGVMT